MKTKALTLILALLTLSCQKPAKNSHKTSQNTETTEATPCCDGWVGEWRTIDGDSLLTDSIVITRVGTFKHSAANLPVGSNGEVYITKYVCNHPFLDSVLWHYCPYKWVDDDIHLTCAGKLYILRYNH